MKLRIYGHSVRIRLDGDECRELAASGRVESALPTGPGDAQRLVYSVETDAAVAEARVSFQGRHLRVLIHPRDAQSLADETEVAVGAVQIVRTVEGTTALKLSVERDYTP